MNRLAQLSGHLSTIHSKEEPDLYASPTAAKPVPKKFKVAVLGAGGGIGQPLALLLKLNDLVGELSLYDIVGTEGVAADISHISSGAKVKGYTGPEKLGECLFGCQLVLIPAGVPRKPGMTRDDLFNVNASIVRDLAGAVAKYCPSALVGIISNPVNSTVPIAAEIFRKSGTYNPRKLLGVTKLDVVRANTFVAEILGVPPADVSVPVIGGHAGVTILPLLSQATPRLRLDESQAKALTERIQDAGTEVVKAKAGKGSATLSMAYAAAAFGDSCLRALGGQPGIVECAYVDSQLTDLPYFASQVRLGPAGIEEYLPLGRFNGYEAAGLRSLKQELSASIQKGIEFVKNSK